MRASRIVAAALAICLFPRGGSAAEPPLELRSPGGEVAIALSLAPDGAAQYAVSFRGREVIAPSLLGLDRKTRTVRVPIDFLQLHGRSLPGRPATRCAAHRDVPVDAGG
ncbi:hypothetical protein [Luteimonas salinilitoris]|uniref:Glycosyl-hydrolase 97 N-terminal domain-containing protein n=1 Tax=Luteimonas salinilitoris TaxID=3237697 RepID=A0ABV4HLB3_9GAMM